MAVRQLVLSSRQIRDRVAELAQQISADYADRNLVMIGVLNGAFIFLADLARAVTIPHQIDFIRVASYGQSATSSGTIRLAKDAEIDLDGRDVLLVEDIVDTGTTLAWLTEKFKEKKAASVRICSLIDKQERREREVRIDYVGFTLQQGFLVGYGLDYAEQHRSLPDIYSLQF